MKLGYYWHKPAPTYDWQVVEIFEVPEEGTFARHNLGVTEIGEYIVRRPDGQWNGPLEEPRE